MEHHGSQDDQEDAAKGLQGDGEGRCDSAAARPCVRVLATAAQVQGFGRSGAHWTGARRWPRPKLHMATEQTQAAKSLLGRGKGAVPTCPVSSLRDFDSDCQTIMMSIELLVRSAGQEG